MAFIPFPAGTVLAFAGSTAPSGWLLCDGSAYERDAYADAYAAIGVTYNTQANPVAGGNWTAPTSTQFRVPDYRGIFLRGVGAPSGLDTVTLGAQQVQKTAKNGLANASSSLTVSLNTESANHSHNDGGHGHGNNMSGIRFVGGRSFTDNPGTVQVTWNSDNFGTAPGVNSGNASLGTQSANHSHTLSSGSAAAQTISGDNETRPVNKGINYIIKI